MELTQLDAYLSGKTNWAAHCIAIAILICKSCLRAWMGSVCMNVSKSFWPSCLNWYEVESYKGKLDVILVKDWAFFFLEDP
jgi:hypothetical protein